MKKFISIGLILVILFGQFGMVGLAEEETPEPDDTVIVVSNVKTYEAKNEDESKNLIKTKDNFKLKITLEVKFGYGGIEKIIYTFKSEILVVLHQVKLGPRCRLSLTKMKKTFTATFENMYYNGGTDTKIPITITYKKRWKNANNRRLH